MNFHYLNLSFVILVLFIPMALCNVKLTLSLNFRTSCKDGTELEIRLCHFYAPWDLCILISLAQVVQFTSYSPKTVWDHTVFGEFLGGPQQVAMVASDLSPPGLPLKVKLTHPPMQTHPLHQRGGLHIWAQTDRVSNTVPPILHQTS